MTQMNKELIYVGDPMCSWCWGFSPVKHMLQEQCEGRAVVSMIVGGLHIDWTEPQDDDRKRFLREHWEDVGKRTGQPFSYDILERNDFIGNTEPACRAAVTARELEGNARALDLFAALQRAYYQENRDMDSSAVLIDLAAEHGFDKEKFGEAFLSAEMKETTVKDFQMAQRLGVTGFPTMLVNDQHGYAYLTMGYQPYDQLGPIVEAWLEDKLDRQTQAAE